MSADTHRSYAQFCYDTARSCFAMWRAGHPNADEMHALGCAWERRGAIHWARAYPSQRRAA